MGFLSLQINVESRRGKQLRRRDRVSPPALEQPQFSHFPCIPAVEIQPRGGISAALPAREGQDKPRAGRPRRPRWVTAPRHTPSANNIIIFLLAWLFYFVSFLFSSLDSHSEPLSPRLPGRGFAFNRGAPGSAVPRKYEFILPRRLSTPLPHPQQNSLLLSDLQPEVSAAPGFFGLISHKEEDNPKLCISNAASVRFSKAACRSAKSSK